MPIKLTISASIALYRVLVRILFTEDGQERKLPFNIKYKLQRCKDMLEKDVLFYEEKRKGLIQTYGTTAEDGTVTIAEDKKEEFNKDAYNLLSTETSHTFKKLLMEEVENINVEGVSCEEMDLFIACMIEDPELVEDLNTKIKEKTNDGGAVAPEDKTEESPAK